MRMGYIFLFLIGFGLAVSGGVTMIAYMNFLPAGVTWMEYFISVQDRIECFLLQVGILYIAVGVLSFACSVFHYSICDLSLSTQPLIFTSFEYFFLMMVIMYLK